MSESRIERDRWLLVKDLVANAAVLSLAEREQFLAGACPDDAPLRHEVEVLLASHDAAGNMFENQTWAASDLAHAGIFTSNTSLYLESGRRLGPYEILEAIGAGGMGAVYRARDVRLDRVVALKVLAPGASGEPQARERFEHEARTISSLNHPNICALYDVGRQDGIDFLVMEYLEGDTLAKRLERGAMDRPSLIRCATEITDALDAAHRQGVIHRDLKPTNIVLTASGAKLLDFGIAKLSDRPSGTEDVEAHTSSTLIAPLTRHSRIAGTLGYMSPEQLRGEEVDARSDLFSLGAVLYEMASARPPFASRDAAMSSAGRSELRPLLDVNPTVGRPLARIIDKALETDRDRRFRTAAEMQAELRRLEREDGLVRGRFTRRLSRIAALVGVSALLFGLTANGWRARPSEGTASFTVRSLAVFPFQNVSADTTQDSFADGLTEELIGHLANISALRVIPRTSVMRYKGTKKPLAEVARELDVDAILETSVSKSAEQARITVKLIHARTNTRLWGDRYERDLKDMLLVQDEIAQAIAHATAIELTPRERARIASAVSIDPAAYQSYLEGRYLFNIRGVGRLEQSVEYFQRAIARDPAYAPAHAGLADAYTVLAGNGYRRPNDVLPLAKIAATKALELDPDSAEAHTSLGGVLQLQDWDWAGAEREYRTAISLNGNYAFAHLRYSTLLQSTGRLDDQIVEATRGQHLDPLAPRMRTARAWGLYLQGRYDQAARILREALALEPNQSWTHQLLGLTYSLQHLRAEAMAEMRDAQTVSGDDGLNIAYSGLVYANLGMRSAATGALNRLIDLSRRQPVPPTLVALVLSRLDATDSAFEWLERAYQVRDPYLPLLILNEPGFASIRTSARYDSVVRRVGLQPR